MWLFNGARCAAPSGAFTASERGDRWIRSNRLTGTLTAYPVDLGVYDWAIACGSFRPKGPRYEGSSFVQRFTSAAQSHVHYTAGRREAGDEDRTTSVAPVSLSRAEEIKRNPVWVFNGDGGTFPSAVFSSAPLGAAWIRRWQLTGTLTAYPMDTSVFDWATAHGYSTAPLGTSISAEALQSYTSVAQEHAHFANGMELHQS